eukprot:s7409_g1.t1
MARHVLRPRTRPSPNQLVPLNDPWLLPMCFCCGTSLEGKEPRHSGRRQGIASWSQEAPLGAQDELEGC